MNKYLKHLLWLGLLGCASSVIANDSNPNSAGYHARHNASSVYYQGPNGAANQAQQQSAPAYRTYLEDTWGAIATDKVKGAFGAAVGMTSEKKAEVVAEFECRNKGNGDNCEVFATYVNSCIAMVVGNNRAFTQSADTIDQASKIALNNCKAEGSECRVYYSECSKPRLLPY